MTNWSIRGGTWAHWHTSLTGKFQSNYLYSCFCICCALSNFYVLFLAFHINITLKLVVFTRRGHAAGLSAVQTFDQ